MIVGKKVILRTVRESDIEKLYELSTDLRDRGDGPARTDS